MSLRTKASDNGFKRSHLHSVSFHFHMHRLCLVIIPPQITFHIELRGDFLCAVCELPGTRLTSAKKECD